MKSGTSPKLAADHIEKASFFEAPLREKPNSKIAVLYQNDDYGKDYLKGLKDGLGTRPHR